VLDSRSWTLPARADKGRERPTCMTLASAALTFFELGTSSSSWSLRVFRTASVASQNEDLQLGGARVHHQRQRSATAARMVDPATKEARNTMPGHKKHAS
jgi:hypothetical protein